MLKIVNCTECLKNKLYKIYKKTLAFTLAETLIVMGVIGVVAALTLPNLNQSTGNKEKVAKLQKIHSNLNDALGRAVVVYGPVDTWCTGLSNADCKKRHFERITEFMKYSKSCTVSTCTGKFDTGSSEGEAMRYGVILADGATIDISGSDGVGTILIDLDGLNKGANKHGVDYFKLDYDSTGDVRAYGHSDSDVPNSGTWSSTDWVIRHGNMDYLKCASQLKFGGPTTCK